MRLTLAELRKRVQSEADAYVLMEELRWGKDNEGLTCPHCGNEKAYFLNPVNGRTRATGPKRTMSERRVWKCAKCRKQFSVLTGTVFHGTKIPLADWLAVMVLACSAKNGIAGREVERLIGVTPESAWFMMHRLREAMRRDPILAPFEGTVMADEAFIGGSIKNMPKAKRNGTEFVRIEPGQRFKPGDNKTTVLSLINAELGEVRSKVVPDVTGATLRKAIADQVDMARTELVTDEAQSYKTFAPELLAHRTVNHSNDEYARREDGRTITTNHVEGYFSQLKRSLDGTHHHVSPEHLQRYLDEFDFRYSTRKLNDGARLNRLMGQVEGRRLSYRPLIGR